MTAVCGARGCSKPSTSQCPKCIELQLPAVYFCSQTCFATIWSEHKLVHREAVEVRKARVYQPPEFNYTGPLRPHYVTPMRTVPDRITRPDYAETGVPRTELQKRGDTKIEIKTPEQVEGMRKVCRLAREVLDIAARAVRVGVTTEEIDKIVHAACIERDSYPSPLNYHGFPKSCCTSVNEVICHGIPDARPLQDGDIVNIDITLYHNGFHGDLNETYFVGNVDEESKRLVRASYDSMMAAIAHVKPGVLFREFGGIISKTVRPSGFSVVRSYCGHGIGTLFHSAPNVPHYAKNKAVGTVRPWQTFTIEPMINVGDWRDVTWPDDWTSTTQDGKRSAQFEHTILVTEDGYEVLTARTDSSPPLFLDGVDTTAKGATT
ncbi:Methionine aminopeptidase [Plasmodiophora brassicae]|uniref:Methionine aminopeptidase n=2 Tax=Plasmodiophora brassicae TaxID=37360 RepID=A0A3P3YE80_PLABS|nr:unnamed protein product [Plasmodiophora brassicae]